MKVIRFIANAALDSIKLSTKYRSLIPRPSSEQLLNLSKDIEERGVKIPLLVNPSMLLIDGYTRYDITKQQSSLGKEIRFRALRVL